MTDLKSYEEAERILSEHLDWLLHYFDTKMQEWSGKTGMLNNKKCREWLHEYRRTMKELADTQDFIRYEKEKCKWNLEHPKQT